MTVNEYIDKRIESLQTLRKTGIQQGVNSFELSQQWARIDELKRLKEKFSTKGEWLI